jgi:hypothetical protein
MSSVVKTITLKVLGAGLAASVGAAWGAARLRQARAGSSAAAEKARDEILGSVVKRGLMGLFWGKRRELERWTKTGT